MVENTPSLAACLPEATRLTELLEAHPSFSFLRIGDGEVQCLLAVQDGKASPRYDYRGEAAASVEKAYSVSGIEARHIPRLREAYRHCTYLDYGESVGFNREYLPRLNLDRAPGLYRNPSAEASNILFAWTAHELPRYLKTHRCLFAGAESALLRELHQDPEYHRASGHFWPAGAPVFFHQVRENGRHFSENLDLIKEDLRAEIARTGADTLFLSLATGAKILCRELADELAIRAIDFGSLPRALTYAGTPGYHSNRSFHNPFMFRLSLPLFMAALERAHPELDLPALVSKAHGQIAQEIQDLQPYRWNTTDAITGQVDLSPERLAGFRAALTYYNAHYRPLAQTDPRAAQLHRDFVRWRRKKGIGWDGKLFLLAVRTKGVLRRVFGGVAHRRVK